MADKEVLTVSLAGEITWRNAQELDQRLGALSTEGRRLVLNVAGVPYVDSAGLAALLRCSRRLRAVGGSLALLNATPVVAHVMRQTRLCEHIACVSDPGRQGDLLDAGASATPVKALRLDVPADPARLCETRARVKDLLTGAGLEPPVVYDLVLALGEALGNAFDHGGGAAGDGSVVVGAALYEDRVVMTVSDCGGGFDFGQGDELPPATDERGRGIRLMLMLTDAVDIRTRGDGHGTCVRLVKSIEPPAGRVAAVPDTDEDDFLAEMRGGVRD